jgi:hypothetical protein
VLGPRLAAMDMRSALDPFAARACRVALAIPSAMVGIGAQIVLGSALFASAPAPHGDAIEAGSEPHHGWSTLWIVGGSVLRRIPRSPDFGMIAVNELGIGFRHTLVRRLSLSFALGGAVFHHRVQPRTIRHEVGLWMDIAARRDVLGWARLQPYVAVHLHGRWFDPIDSHFWTLMGGVGPAAGLELRLGARAGLLAQGEVFWESVAAERSRGAVRGNALSLGGRAALTVHY